MNALELHGVQKTYPDFTLGPIDLTLPGGTVCGLIGENGAGKSTTLKLILGILPPESGAPSGCWGKTTWKHPPAPRRTSAWC